MKRALLLTLVCILGVSSDTSMDPRTFITHELPSDEKYMCSIGNGHIATNVYSDTIYMNGLFNGEKGESHRARIPAWNNIQILNETLAESSTPLAYTLDTSDGTFYLRFESDAALIEHHVYAHRYFNRAIINQIRLYSHGDKGVLKIGVFPGPESEDIDFKERSSITIRNRTIWHTCGKTLKVEDPKYQAEPSNVCVYWTDVPDKIELLQEGEQTFIFIMTIDSSDDVARKEMEDILQLKSKHIYSRHVKEWEKHINTGLYFNIYGNNELSKVVNGVWYYLISSLPCLNTNQPVAKFYGLSPGGLSRGGYLRDYQGHSFWDTETWMFPYILMFHPELAESILDYRIRNYGVAADLAILSGHKGIRFPWESAFTGTEVTPDCCPEVVNFEHHITGCVGFAIRQYLAVTGDRAWLKRDGCDVISKIAEFWASRVTFNEKTKFYDIENAMGPDEDHPNITNSVFTNVVAGLALYLGDYGACLCDTETEREPSWSDIARKIALVYDEDLDYHPQYEGYERPTPIKQADAVLLGFPLLYKMNPSTRENDLLYYENVTRDNGPAMTWSMHSIGHLRIGNDEQAAIHFNKSYQPYVREPFKIWTEAREPEIGAVNFITGMGGFMQAILFGYGGISIYLDRLEIRKPQLLPNTVRVDIKGLKYLGSEFLLTIEEPISSLKVISVDHRRPLVMVKGKMEMPLTTGFRAYLIGDETYEIRRVSLKSCQVPLDLIGQKDDFDPIQMQKPIS